MTRASTAWRWAGAVAIVVAAVGCSTTPDTSTPGTSAVLGGSDGDVVTPSSEPSNSEEGIPANPGSVSEERPAPG